MERQPRVSIGLAVYDAERYLEAAVESLLGQDFPDFEIVISDNGSGDGTPGLCESLAARDSRIAFHRTPVNRGAAWNYNRVFALSRAPYFKWAAHDDIHLPGFLSRCVEVLDSRPDVSLVYTGVADVDEQGECVGEHPLHPYADEEAVADRVASMLCYVSSCVESFGLARREQLERTRLIGPYTSSDRTWMLELALQGKFHEVPEVLFLHRQHATRSMAKYRDARARNAWFDPARAEKLTFPRWRLLTEYVRSITRAQVDTGDKLRCLRHVAGWAAANARGLAGDLKSNGRELGRRGLSLGAGSRTA